MALGVDVSGSVDEVEARLQREGCVSALTDPRVVRAIGSGMLRRIAVMYFEWAGDETQSVFVDWTLVHDSASARRLAETISMAPMTRGRYTAIGSPGSFMVVAEDFQSFASAIRRKLILEIAGLRPPQVLFRPVADRVSPPCDAGERRRQQRQYDNF